MSLLDRVTVDPAVCHGAPTLRGLRYPVEMIVGLLAAGMTTDEVLVSCQADPSTNSVVVTAAQ